MSEFYVYHLVDPRNDKVFYVGKGKGHRVVFSVLLKNHVARHIGIVRAQKINNLDRNRLKFSNG